MKEDFTMFEENDDVSLHAMRKPKTMDNNCVNLQCLNNRQKLIELKELDSKLEKILSKIKSEKINKLKESSFPSINKKTCIACMLNEICIIFRPCNHLCTCENCSEKINICPMCRQLITSRMKIKLPNYSV